MIKHVYIVIFWIIVILLAVNGCTQIKPTVINTNKYIQTVSFFS